MHQVYSTVIHSSQNGETSQCLSGDEQIYKVWYPNTIEHYLAIKRSKIFICSRTWMDFQKIMLSETNQTQKDKY